MSTILSRGQWVNTIWSADAMNFHYMSAFVFKVITIDANWSWKKCNRLTVFRGLTVNCWIQYRTLSIFRGHVSPRRRLIARHCCFHAVRGIVLSLQWRHNDCVPNHRRLHCLLNCWFGRRSKKTSKPLAFVQGIHRSPVNSPHKGPVTRKMLPFDDVIMYLTHIELYYSIVVYGSALLR